MKTHRFAALLLSGSAILGSASPVSAQGPPAGPASFDRHDISGIWSLPYDGRRIPPAVLAPGVTQLMLDAAAQKDRHALRYCNLLGIPVVMDNGRPITIVQGRTQINVTPEMNTTPRYFYLRETHIGEDFDPTTVGDSIARWEGDSLVVDTVGLKGELGIVGVPGGGYRTEDTHLVERYRLLDANTLAVTFTWIDPKVYQTPHTYEFRYTRLNSRVYAPQAFPVCNPYDQERTNFVEGRLTPANQTQPAPQPISQRAPEQPDLRVEGDWVRTDPEGSGSFDALGAQFPKARLLPAAQAAGAPAGAAGPSRDYRAGATAPLRPGEVVVTNPTPCAPRGGGGNTVGAGLITPDSVGVHIVEGKNEVRIAGERGGWRFIYLDGRKHPDPFVPTGAGHSIGRYEGNALVVETVGFTPGPVPGGGQRTAETRLTERFEVAPDGKSMKVTYTWEDPKIYAAPHTYRLIFDRVPKVAGRSYAFEEWCDASDPGEGQSIRAPEQR